MILIQDETNELLSLSFSRAHDSIVRIPVDSGCDKRRGMLNRTFCQNVLLIPNHHWTTANTVWELSSITIELLIAVYGYKCV